MSIITKRTVVEITDPEKVANILDVAAGLIDNGGWTKWAWREDVVKHGHSCGTRYCSVGALRVAAGYPAASPLADSTIVGQAAAAMLDVVNPSLVNTARVVEDAFGDLPQPSRCYRSTNQIIDWNDNRKQARTVRNAMKRAAERLRAA